jgi:hypothetical protein
MKTSELTGAALDRAVHQAWCEGACHDEPFPSYSTDWAQGGPIIERNLITIFRHDEEWFAHSQLSTPEDFHGDTPLIAAMRCFVASQLGDAIDISEEIATDDTRSYGPQGETA